MMQAEVNDLLVLQFAGERPDDVAALLADSDLGELSGLIEGLPESIAAGIAVRLPSWQLTGLLGVMNAAKLCRMIVTAPTDEAVTLVSHLQESRYEALLAACPAEQHKALQTLLEFPSHSLAALVTTQFIRVSSDTPCGAFADQLASSPKTLAGPVLVVDRQGKYQGMVDLQAVFSRKNGVTPVGEIAAVVEPLNGLTDASTALTSRQWASYPELPVVDVQHRVLGVVSRAALQRVVGDATPRPFTLERILSELATGYLNICGKILETALGRSK
jgi:magnesium transporter